MEAPGLTEAQLRLAERRVEAALRRLHRREPLKTDHRVDAVLAELREDPGERRPGGHRGAGSLRALSDAVLFGVVDAMVASGVLARRGHRVRLAEHEPVIADPAMAQRVERLLTGLREVGAEAPRVEGLAARLGIPSGVVAQLRGAGLLVTVGEGIDYPADLLAALMERLDASARRGPLTVARVRDELHTTRRHAEALLEHHRSRHGRGPRPPTRRDRQGVG